MTAPALARAGGNVYRLLNVPPIVQAHNCAMRQGFVRQDDGTFAASIMLAGGKRKTLRWNSEAHVLAWARREVEEFFAPARDKETWR